MCDFPEPLANARGQSIGDHAQLVGMAAGAIVGPGTCFGMLGAFSP